MYSVKSHYLYTGYTTDLKQRLLDHNSEKGSHYTNINKPYILVFYEAYLDKADALKQEKFYKSGYGKEVLNEKIAISLMSLRD